ncbi:conserved phage C-terminal domain-containing protein [Aeromonas veronii]|uniref:conserved phage C-terminal domain-containing protein n=1 Tax=Aeromonas veronii TaxID=654 RepID=UPI0021E81AD2|nr:conserved phage C-terminal domain-containing protein [Aeromonas veronii]MCV3283416.1 conserved phage C-terminal domain-containing protein [Aeromonas veronii]
MGEVIRLAAQAVAPINRKASNNMSDNRRSGYVVCWRSLLQADWARNATKLAAWMRLIGLASYEAGCVRYKGRDWHLMRGQLVISATELGQQLCDERGRGLDKKATERLLGWFAKEGMLELRGTPWGSIIEICNYDDYQAALQPVESKCEQFAIEQFEGATNGAPIGAHIGVPSVPPKAFADAALSGDAVAPTVAPIGAPTVTTTEQEVKELDSTEDLKQISCPVSVETERDRKRKAALAVSPDAKAVLEHFNAVADRRYQAKPTALQNINARLADGYSVTDLQLVVDFKTAHWAADLKMSEYLRPMTVFAPQKFESYLAAAKRWNSIGRPRCVNGEWEGYERKRPMSNLANAQKQAQAIMENSGVGYDDNTIL